MIRWKAVVDRVWHQRLKAFHSKRLIVREKKSGQARERVAERERDYKYVRKPPPPLSRKSQGYRAAQHDCRNQISGAEDDKLCHASILISEYLFVAGRPVILVLKKLSA